MTAITPPGVRHPPMGRHLARPPGESHLGDMMIVAEPSQKDSLVPTHLRSGGGTQDLLAWDEIFTSVGEYSAGRSEQFFLANGGGHYFRLFCLYWLILAFFS